MKICPVGADLFHAGGRRHDKANSRFLQFCERAYKRVRFARNSYDIGQAKTNFGSP
jgi:hypothetical protein